MEWHPAFIASLLAYHILDCNPSKQLSETSSISFLLTPFTFFYYPNFLTVLPSSHLSISLQAPHISLVAHRRKMGHPSMSTSSTPLPKSPRLRLLINPRVLFPLFPTAFPCALSVPQTKRMQTQQDAQPLPTLRRVRHPYYTPFPPPDCSFSTTPQLGTIHIMDTTLFFALLFFFKGPTH